MTEALREIVSEASKIHDRYLAEVERYCASLEGKQPPPTEDGSYWGLHTYSRSDGYHGPIVEQVAGGHWNSLVLDNGVWYNGCWREKDVGSRVVFVPQISGIQPKVPSKEILRRLAGV